MLPIIVGAGFAAVCTVIGYFGKRAITSSDEFRSSVRDDIVEMRVDIAVLFERNGLRPATPVDRQRARRAIGAPEVSADQH